MQEILIIVQRELKKYWRNKSRIVGTLGMPFFMLFIFGAGLDNVVDNPMFSGGYSQFIMPGIIGMVLLFNSIFSGVSVIWDKQFGFMKEMLVAPISRVRIIIGKTLGGASTSIFQGFLMLALSFILGVRPTWFIGTLIAIPIMFLISISFVAIGTAIASQMNDMHGFQLIMNFLIMPLFFLSGALFPLNNVPAWLRVLTYIDPMTYAVEALRFCFLGTSAIAFPISIAVLLLFAAASITAGTILFRRMQI
jgi:ABC-2 type transport system permease protein